jgi:hypothetical protein
VSPYEALSLLVSSVGTLGTVYIGLRQLRQTAPTPAVAYHAPVAVHPGPAPAGHAAPYGPHLPPPAPRSRPSSVNVASLVLFVAAATHPFVVVLYYAIRFATAPSAAAEELGGEGFADLLVFGGIAFVSALLGVFVTRGSRLALWSVWILGALSMVLLCVLALSAVLTALGPEASGLGGFELMFLGYLAFVLVAYVVGAGVLVTAGSRAFFRRAQRWHG